MYPAGHPSSQTLRLASLPPAGSLCGDDGAPVGLSHSRSWNEKSGPLILKCDCDLQTEPTLIAGLLNLVLGGVPALTASLGRTADHPVDAEEMDDMQGSGSKGGLPEPLE